MSDFEHPNNKQAPTSEQETNIEPPQPSELPPYRQSDNLSKKNRFKTTIMVVTRIGSRAYHWCATWKVLGR